MHSTLSIIKKRYAEIFLCNMWIFIKGNIIIGEWEIFVAEVFLCYSWFFIKGDFIIGGVECTCSSSIQSFQDHHTLSKFNLKSINHHTLIERCLRNHYIKFGGNQPPEAWNVDFSTPPIGKLATILSMKSSGKPLNNNFYTHWYQLCNIDFHVI